MSDPASGAPSAPPTPRRRVGGLTLGIVESLVIVGVSSGYKDALTFSVLIAIMIFMPHGMLGRGGRGGG